MTTKALGASGGKKSLLKKFALENEGRALQTKGPSQAAASATATPPPKIVAEISKKALKQDQETTPEKLEEEMGGWVGWSSRSEDW